MEVLEVAEAGDLRTVAALICSRVVPGDVVELRGSIGAGKTTLVQACAETLGISEPVTSPTFSLAHRYAGTPPVAHLDLYRLEVEPVRDAGDIVDYLKPDVIAFVEWPEFGAAWLPPAALVVHITVSPNGLRRFELTNAAPTRGPS